MMEGRGAGPRGSHIYLHAVVHTRFGWRGRGTRCWRLLCARCQHLRFKSRSTEIVLSRVPGVHSLHVNSNGRRRYRRCRNGPLAGRVLGQSGEGGQQCCEDVHVFMQMKGPWHERGWGQCRRQVPLKGAMQRAAKGCEVIHRRPPYRHVSPSPALYEATRFKPCPLLAFLLYFVLSHVRKLRC
jgi:hypothetical protein